MSGIVALLTLDETSVAPLLGSLTQTLRRAGADASDTWCTPPPQATGAGRVAAVGLGHTLLRTTVESERAQPASLDGRVWITADARIDGRAELTERLRARGEAPASQSSDVELVLHAYRTWGLDCLGYLIGDFAFALWDDRCKRLFCARDHFGVTPFYYAESRHWLICSNVLDCVRRHPGVTAALNDQAVADELIFGSNPEPHTTLFADIRCLPAAHCLVWENGAVKCQRYWTLPAEHRLTRYAQPADYAVYFRTVLDEAVADRLRTPAAGILMSGGLDSVNVAAAARRVQSATGRPRELRAYTGVFKDVMADEEHTYAGQAAAALGIAIDYIVSDANMGRDPRQATVDERHRALRLAAAHGPVLLTGQGGDPAVYPDMRHWIGRLIRGELRELGRDVRQHFREHGQRPPLYLRANFKRWLRRPVWRPPFPPWLQADLVTRLQLRDRLERVTHERLSDRGRSGMNSAFWASLLSARDPGITGVPVKVWHPFFDTRLLRYLAAVPPVPWFVNKHLLRAALEGAVPDAVRLRPKTPLASWPDHAYALRHGVPVWMDDLATAAALAPYVDRAGLRAALHAPQTMRDYEYQSCIRAVHLAARLQALVQTRDLAPQR